MRHGRKIRQFTFLKHILDKEHDDHWYLQVSEENCFEDEPNWAIDVFGLYNTFNPLIKFSCIYARKLDIS